MISGDKGDDKCQLTKSATKKWHKNDSGDSAYKPFIAACSAASE